MTRPIYLDYNATSPIAPEVLEAMMPYLGEHFGNPSSSHLYGQTAAAAVDKARQQMARLSDFSTCVALTRPSWSTGIQVTSQPSLSSFRRGCTTAGCSRSNSTQPRALSTAS